MIRTGTGEKIISDTGQFCLQDVLDRAPFVIWSEHNKRVIWRNKPFADLFQDRDAEGIREFEPASRIQKGGETDRLRLWDTGTKTFREFIVSKSHTGDVEHFYAADASPLIETEQELQRFIQTLTETFAHLPIGLAIFDKKRDLSLFNPALSDLLEIPAEWLIRRPDLRSFLDRLRNEGMMPEPEHSKSLRQELTNLEKGSIAGTYQAEWTQPTGRIYKIIGRPHLKGGIALLFEDISKALIVERQYRSELEQLYSAFESLAQGVVIFDQAGEVVFVNSVFDEMWGCKLAGALTAVTAQDVSRILQSKCLPSPVWGDLRDFILDNAERSQWQAKATATSGFVVEMTFSPISGGQVFCEFNSTGLPDTMSAKQLRHIA